MTTKEFQALKVDDLVCVRRSGKVYKVLAVQTTRRDIWPPYAQVPCPPFLVFRSISGLLRTCTLDPASIDIVLPLPPPPTRETV